ncbi:helix-turn-helix transcriptional regulator [Luteimicrobium sp. NPDC057192]|uniref:helix-turn-helix transcriptional regulator n=1 Tax=Luteimicrobium sp. NPDC057192 TaxID=3346042 RepID=UPI00362DA85D
MTGTGTGTGTGVRMLALLDLLESGGLRGRRELAQRLGVDERTVRRDVVRLLDAGVPVESVRGRYGGYRLGPGYRLPPLMLTDDEGLAVVVALAVAGGRDESDVPAATAAAKIQRVLPAPSADRLASVLAAAVVPDDADEPVAATVLLTVADAVREHRPLEIVHRRRGEPAGPAPRVVHPYGLVRRAGRWYLTGLALDRGAERTFRLDRVERARTLAGRFRPPSGYDAVARLEELQGAGYRYEVRVRVRATEPEVRRFLPASVARVRADAPGSGDGWLRVELGADRLDWLPGVLAALDRPFVVERPRELLALLDEFALRLRARVNGARADVGSAPWV